MKTLFVVTCKPGKELRAAEEVMDLLLYCDEGALAVPTAKGLALGTTSLGPEEAAKCLEGKVSAYINWIYFGDELCEKCKALKKQCLEEVEEGFEAFCTGRAIVKIKKALRAKRGVLVSVPLRRNER
ncbi:hypothetical protein [Ignicoccus hospitalis]|uniref:Uncharacterized protein n=1 Tax=Ignicoccus hospitalis (strain KIN4/I / DSM 18386 / JCM 14125) TaxID=453591 RepID=A8A9V7_IGNH4|nr:hypothetical protein [Ignicoccus hospitalis]ABU81709.1 hypothetical protein Igni_0527 [Ignicoccus hospitalis KIN4/I]